MTVSELRKLYQQQILQEAEILHDVAIPGWIIEFRGNDGALYELTDTLGCPVSFDTVEQARDHVHLVADCPMQVEHLYRFFER
ncbi:MULTISPECIES: hypothetical protein [Aeromonas]|uniref:Thymidylate kinase n=1 Tax=Aeromonas veronii AMC34 TaxID=1073383 RepID=K1IPW8_AERVE|nr:MULTISPECIES: hypothetical protein [Aeromonas]EKB21100.1 hypothetical protein HMPREF1168_01373 [Aeromonas veronii AMC34]MCF5764178.1 hypothetical protein [Aeromonas veronii]QWZ80177.1 hypothetical protein I6L44_13745 [Aeromonas sp. FDAARGOS 1414]UDN22449.1 hypothetical protein LEO77_18085 [Aeromonas veronii]